MELEKKNMEVEFGVLAGRIFQISAQVAPDYPYSQHTIEERLWAIEQGSLGRKAALDDMHAWMANIKNECGSILMLMDGLAEQWGDEGVFRRCRDRLRVVAETPEKFAEQQG